MGEAGEVPVWACGERQTLEAFGRTCEAIFWRNQNFQRMRGMILYVPGLPGDTLEAFGGEASQWHLGGKAWEIVGLLHSGTLRDGNVINGETTSAAGGKIREAGVTVDDWVEDVKTAIMYAKSIDQPFTIVGHSFGGPLALTALSELIEEGHIEKFSSQIRFIAVASPFYRVESLPDRRPLLGTDPNQAFTLYSDQNNPEAMSANDPRIPMASVYAYQHIWQFLKKTNLIQVHPDETVFNTSFMRLVHELEKHAIRLGETDISINTFFSFQDRCVSRLAGDDLQKMIDRPITTMAFDLPGSYYLHFKETNAHDLVTVWVPYVLECLCKT